ncbi:DUF2196 domain-containing protein [Natronosalvus rutilus]|uniref:YwbE family protein n=1 Tax=Natronosalvus rutilus TaxID=2953753 RepID=A0A9E7NEL8_9EURY|nr:DUF2196 domain-containing protein [Natronosalvus rutilus]UTF55458.1 YwbE family protein [Natronosalvus rutilus]
MSDERPSATELRQGMTVRIVRGDQDVQSTDQEPIVGEIGTVIGDDPDGTEAELKNGAVGHVLEVVPDA